MAHCLHRMALVHSSGFYTMMEAQLITTQLMIPVERTLYLFPAQFPTRREQYLSNRRSLHFNICVTNELDLSIAELCVCCVVLCCVPTRVLHQNYWRGEAQRKVWMYGYIWIYLSGGSGQYESMISNSAKEGVWSVLYSGSFALVFQVFKL